MRNESRRSARAGALVLGAIALATLSACGGGGGGTTDQEPPPRTRPFVLDPPGTRSNSGSVVMGVDRNSIDANRSDTLTVFAQFLDPSGLPLIGIPVTFEASFSDILFLDGRGEEDRLPGELPTTVQTTDGTGTATATLRSGSTAGRLGVGAFGPLNLNLGGLMFLQLFDVGFVTGSLQVFPTEYLVTDPNNGSTVEFLVTGGEPFGTPRNLVGAAAGGLGQVAQDGPPYLLQNAGSGVGTASLVEDGRFPVPIVYTMTGRVAGTHSFSIADAGGSSVSASVTVEFTELELLPSSVTLFVGTSQDFRITGGVAPYSCSANGGTLTPSTIAERGGSFRFTATDVISASSFSIICQDQAGQIIEATVMIEPIPTPSEDGTAPTPAPPAEANRIVMQGNPPSLSGVEGGDTTITANVLDQSLNPLPGENVVFTISLGDNDPAQAVPSLSTFGAVSDGNGQAVTILNVPAGTAPQFVTVTAEATNGTEGSVEIGITSTRTEPAGAPDRISAALLRSCALGDNNDGTFFTVLSSLVVDAEGNPVDDGVQVNWVINSPSSASVLSPTFTNGAPPCDVGPYVDCEDETMLSVTAQPGTAVTCVVYPESLAGGSGSVTATVVGTNITATTGFGFPDFMMPVSTPAPTQSPAPTPTPGPPTVAPGSATLTIGGMQSFGVSGGSAPYTVIASGGTAMPTTVMNPGGTFTYTAATPGVFTIVISDANGQLTTATVSNM